MKSLSVVMVARFEYPKRQDLLIAAAKKLHKINFNFIGEGQNLNAFKENIPPNITFFGALTEIESVLRESDVFVLLSENEGMPLAVIEARACGKPMILSDIPSMEIFIQNNGLLVKNNIDSVLKALEDISKMDMVSMGAYSQKLFNERFNLLNRQKEYIAFYKSMIS